MERDGGVERSSWETQGRAAKKAAARRTSATAASVGNFDTPRRAEIVGRAADYARQARGLEALWAGVHQAGKETSKVVLRQAILDELVPWAAGRGDPVRGRVEARR